MATRSEMRPPAVRLLDVASGKLMAAAHAKFS